MTSEDKIKEICREDADAVEFCLAVLRLFHWIDDIWDGEQSYTVAESVTLNLAAMSVFSHNPFFARNAPALLALITQAALAWLDSEDMAQSSDLGERRASQVLKSDYHKIFWHVAFLCGGFDHAGAMSARHREFDYDLPL